MKDFRAAQMKIKKLEQALKKHKYGQVSIYIFEIPIYLQSHHLAQVTDIMSNCIFYIYHLPFFFLHITSGLMTKIQEKTTENTALRSKILNTCLPPTAMCT